MNGTVLREKRRTLGLRQRDVAHQLGCTQAMISYWEGGERDIHPKYVKTLKKILKIGK